jgi:hypothetical protein
MTRPLTGTTILTLQASDNTTNLSLFNHPVNLVNTLVTSVEYLTGQIVSGPQSIYGASAYGFYVGNIGASTDGSLLVGWTNVIDSSAHAVMLFPGAYVIIFNSGAQAVHTIQNITANLPPTSTTPTTIEWVVWA